MEWLTLEVFDADSAAWAWRDRHEDDLVTVAISTGASYWEWHQHPYGVALEACWPDESALEAFRNSPVVAAALERAPDRASGVLIYRGRGGGSGASVRRPKRPPLGAGALALPEPDGPAPEAPPVEMLLAAI
jgi:hypothetical protein